MANETERPIGLDDIRPVIHQHYAMMVAGGMASEKAFSMAIKCAVDVFDDAIFLAALRHVCEVRGAMATYERLIAAPEDDDVFGGGRSKAA